MIRIKRDRVSERPPGIRAGRGVAVKAIVICDLLGLQAEISHVLPELGCAVNRCMTEMSLLGFKASGSKLCGGLRC